MRILSEQSILNSKRRAVARLVGLSAGGCVLAAGLLAGVFHSRNRARQSSLPAGPVVVSATAPAPAAKPKKPGRWHEVGLASWYGPEFDGRQTANGETFHMDDLTCAHRSLPLGTWIKVTNLRTRKWIVVRVNDRGPALETRIADLSAAAAQLLGMSDRGVTRVRLDRVSAKVANENAEQEKDRLAKLAAAPAAAPAEAAPGE